MSNYYTHPHFSIPLFHIHKPHFEWHRVRRPLRAALLSGALLTTVAVAAVAARELPIATVTSSASTVAGDAVREAFARVDVTRHYQHRDRSVHFEHMYGGNSPSRNIEDMYAKPRSRRY